MSTATSLVKIIRKALREVEKAEKKPLRQGEHRTPPKDYPKKQSQYAGPGYSFPVNTASRVHAALSYFNKHKWASPEERRAAARKIMAAARKFGIHVADDDNVARAAHSD